MVTPVNDYISTIACIYVVYLLLCLKDPARYYGKPPGDAIDIINIAVNAQQAKNVFFKGLKSKIDQSPWFEGKYHAKMDTIEFKKQVTLHAGHSEREAWEGLNLIFCVLDEIAAFAIENSTGHAQAKTAQDIYNMFRASVDSRFPKFGKVVLLSFPRFKGDFIQQRYDEVIADKDVIIREKKMKIDDEMPDGVQSNEFTVEWEEDKIIAYSYPNVFALKRPTWEVNPLISIEDLKTSFLSNPVDALSRFACMPPDAIDAFFPSREKIEYAFRSGNIAVDETGRFADWFKPIENKEYFIHVDLAQKHDRAAVALAHADSWVRTRIMGDQYSTAPKIVVDAVRYWTPTKEISVDFTEIKNYILDLKRLGFDVKMVTFDRWNCLPEDALVYTPSGPVQIKDVSVGDLVVTRYGESPVGNVWNTGEQEVFRITTRLGYEFEGTGNHKVLTGDGWKTIHELTTSDELVLDNSFMYKGDDLITEGQAYVLGALVADGWVNDKNDQQINFTTADKQFADRFNELIVTEWGFKNKAQVKLQDKTVGSTKDTHTYTYWDKSMISRMRSAGLTKSLAVNKTVPFSVMQSGDSVRAAFLAGYIDGDGGVQTYIDKAGVVRQRLSMDTISETLANQLVWMLLSLKLEPTRMRQIRTNGGVVHRLSLEGKKGARALEIIHPYIERKSSIDINTQKKNVKERWVFEGGTIKLKIKKIESIGVKKTYDISVPEHEEFIAGGFVTHNSHDIMQQLRDYGLHAETLSVAKKHYEDMKLAISEERVEGPFNEILIEELVKLRIVKDKVDHPRKGSKDLADATCGAIYNVIAHARRDTMQELEVHTFGSVRPPSHVDTRPAIDPPKASGPMPDNLKLYFDIV